jgi:hypothetical protein
MLYAMGTYVSRLARRALRVPVENEPKPISWIGLAGRDEVIERRDVRVDCLAGCRVAPARRSRDRIHQFLLIHDGSLVFVEPVTRPDLLAFAGSRCSMDVQQERPFHERPRQQVCRCRGLSRRTPPATDPPLAECGQAADTHPSR